MDDLTRPNTAPKQARAVLSVEVSPSADQGSSDVTVLVGRKSWKLLRRNRGIPQVVGSWDGPSFGLGAMMAAIGLLFAAIALFILLAGFSSAAAAPFIAMALVPVGVGAWLLRLRWQIARLTPAPEVCFRLNATADRLREIANDAGIR